MNRLPKILAWLVTVLVPVVLTLAAVRAVMGPWYVEVEYRTPEFPADPFGFTLEERLQYSKVAIEYLVNEADISFLGDLRFPEGQQAPPYSCANMADCTYLYNARELQHMLDVKLVVQGALRVWYVSLAALLLLGLAAWRMGWLPEYRNGLRRGGWLTLILIGAVILFVLVGFSIIFVAFHQVFFQSGTWSFPTSDTLIRLFPERFWRDTFMVVGGLTALFGLATVFATRGKKPPA